MSKNVITQKTNLYRVIIQLPIAGATSGKQTVPIPFAVDNYALINNTAATVLIADGELFSKPGVATQISPFTYISSPLEQETQKVTVFWDTTTVIQDGSNTIELMFANEEIRLQVGSLAAAGVAANVTVANFPAVQAVTIPALPTGGNVIGVVGVNALPALSTGTNVIGHVISDIKLSNIVLQNAVSVVGVGSPYTLTGSEKTLVIEVTGAANTVRTVLFQVCGLSGVYYPIQGVRLSDFTVGAQSTNLGEMWQFDVTGVTGVQANLTAITGGTVTVTGRVVG